MSKGLVHVIIPNGTRAACGIVSVYRNVCGFKNGVTCKRCKKTSEYKELKFKQRAK